MTSLSVEGLLLKKYPIKDADILCTLFTMELGKVQFVAKGVRKIVSRRLGALQTGSYVRCIFVKSKGHLYLQHIVLVSALTAFKQNAIRMTALVRLLFLIDRLMPLEVQDTQFYAYVTAVIKRLHHVRDEDVGSAMVDSVGGMLVLLGHTATIPQTWGDCITICESVIEEKMP
jgi:DNA repair protein RecO